MYSENCAVNRHDIPLQVCDIQGCGRPKILMFLWQRWVYLLRQFSLNFSNCNDYVELVTTSPVLIILIQLFVCLLPFFCIRREAEDFLYDETFPGPIPPPSPIPSPSPIPEEQVGMVCFTGLHFQLLFNYSDLFTRA